MGTSGPLPLNPGEQLELQQQSCKASLMHLGKVGKSETRDGTSPNSCVFLDVKTLVRISLLGVCSFEALLKGCSYMWCSVEAIPQIRTDVEDLIYVASPSLFFLVCPGTHMWCERL